MSAPFSQPPHGEPNHGEPSDSHTSDTSDTSKPLPLLDSTDAFFFLDTDWRFTSLSRQAESLLHRNSADLLGKVVWDEFPEAASSPFGHAYHRAMRDQTPVAFEAFYPGLATWFSVRALPSATDLAVYFHPVKHQQETHFTDREHALTVARLAESEALLSGVMDSAMDAIIATNARQQITLFNPAAVRLFGYTRDEALEMSLAYILPGWKRLAHASTEQASIEQASTDISSTSKANPVAASPVLSGWHRDGTAFPVEVAVSQSQVEGRPVFTAVVRDITERLRAEETLRLKVSAFQASTNAIILVEAAPVASVDREDFPIVSVNPAFERMTGYSAAEVQGRNCRFLQNTDRNQPELALVRAALTRDEPVSVTLRNYRKDGTRFYNELSLSPVRDKEGLVTHFVGILNDVTERVQSEERQRTFLREVLYSVTEGRLRLCDSPADLPTLPLQVDPLAVVVLHSSAELSEVRRQVRVAGQTHGFPEERWRDVMSGASECAMNALQHGGGPATVRVYSNITNITDNMTDNEDTLDTADTLGAKGSLSAKLQIWVTDEGAGIDVTALPRATLMKGYSGGGGFGHGFFLMLRSVDAVYLLTGPAGTTVVLEQNREEPEPEFF